MMGKAEEGGLDVVAVILAHFVDEAEAGREGGAARDRTDGGRPLVTTELIRGIWSPYLAVKALDGGGKVVGERNGLEDWSRGLERGKRSRPDAQT